MATARILVVEDEGVVALDIQHQLQELGYEVAAIAASGEEAVRLARTLRPDLILMDIHLQGPMDGIQAAEQIGFTQHIPVVYVTAYADTQTLEWAKRTRPYGYINKPFELRDLKTTIEIALYRFQIEVTERAHTRRLEQEIAERKKVEQALARERELLQVLMDNMPDWIFFKDTHSRIMRSNRSHAQCFGVDDPQELTGKTDFDLFPFEDAQRFYDEEQRIIQTRQATVGRVGQTPNYEGDVFWMSETKVPIINEGGEVTGLVGISRNISDQKETEEALQAREGWFRTLIEHFPLALQVFDAAGVLVQVNQAWETLWGTNGADVVGVFNPLEDDQVKASGLAPLLERVFAGETVHVPDTEYDPALSGLPGTKRWIRTHASHIKGDDGQVKYVVVLNEDITERKQAEDALRRRDAMLQAVNASADLLLKTPDWHQEIDGILELLGKASNVERVTLFDHFVRDGVDRSSLCHEWVKPGLSSLFDYPAFQDIDLIQTGSNEALKLWKQGQATTADYSDFSAERMSQELLKPALRSLLTAPVMVNGKLWGQLNFESARVPRDWTEKETEVLQTAANMLGTAIERQQTGVALRESEARYRAVVEDQTELISRFTADGIITFVNDACCRFFGETRDQIIGTSVYNRMPTVDREMVRDALTVLTPDNPVVVVLNQNVAVDGAVHWHSWTNRMLFAQDGTTVEIQSVGRDVTAQKRAEDALRESEERHRLVSELTSDYFYGFEVSRQGALDINWISGAFQRITGYPEETIRDIDSWFAVIHPADLPQLQQAAQTTLANQRSVIEYRIRTQAGEERWLRDLTQPIWNDDQQRVVEIIGAVKDITELRLAEQQRLALALERERVTMLASFIQDLSHEFRTPLSVINTKAYLLEQVASLGENAAHVQIIKSQADYITDLVEAMLTTLRLDTRADHEFATLQVNDLLQAITTRVQRQLEEKQLAFVVNLDEALPTIQGNRTELYRVFLNLTTNAIQNTIEGTITLRTYQHNHQVVIEIQDTGKGITAEDLPHIFDRFFRVDKARTTRGAGLGLYIARKIIDVHQGQIEVQSTPDMGSTFRVQLPVHTPPH